MVIVAAVVLCAVACDRSASTQEQASRLPVKDDAPHVEIPDTEPDVRVRIRRIAPGRSVSITAQSGRMKVHVGDRVQTMSGPGAVVRRDGRWHLGDRTVNSPASHVDLTADEPILVEQSGGDARAYPGMIRLVATGAGDPPDDTFEVINVVAMQDYLPGVLAGELYAGWPAATFEAQAVAARSFTASECYQRRTRAWDVLDTPVSQVYVGVTDLAEAHAATRRTRGQVLAWNERLVPGYFSSCCGGRAATATEAIGPNPINDIPPLGGHTRPPKCDQAPVYRWSRSWDNDTVTAAIRAWARQEGHEDLAEIGPIASLRPWSPNRHGRPTSVEITDLSGRQVAVSSDTLARVLERAGLDGVYSGWINADRDGSTLEVTGRGFGHGVGLCQYGAEAMGAAGSPYEVILRFYYPGAKITKAW